MTAPGRLALALALALGLGLCGCAEERGRGQVVGSLSVPDCDEEGDLVVECGEEVSTDRCEAFDLRADFFALEPYGHSALVRIQRGGRAIALTDALILEIRDVRLLRGALGAVQPVGPEQNVRGSLGLFHLCPESTQSFSLTGLVRFDTFGVNKGDSVSGVIERIEVRDGRGVGAGAVLGVLHGDFEFTVRKGPPYQPFAE